MERVLNVTWSSDAKIILSLPSFDQEAGRGMRRELVLVIPDKLWCSATELMTILPIALEDACND